MNQGLTNEQIARVFAMYLYTPTQVLWDGKSYPIAYAFNKDLSVSYESKLLLTPLEKISDEDAVEVAKILRSPHAAYFLSDEKNMIESVKYWVKHGLIAVFTSNGVQNHFAFQYLIQKGYTVPLFIEPNHPANGKDAIQLGLAIDKTLQP